MPDPLETFREDKFFDHFSSCRNKPKCSKYDFLKELPTKNLDIFNFHLKGLKVKSFFSIWVFFHLTFTNHRTAEETGQF